MTALETIFETKVGGKKWRSRMAIMALQEARMLTQCANLLSCRVL